MERFNPPLSMNIVRPNTIKTDNLAADPLQKINIDPRGELPVTNTPE